MRHASAVLVFLVAVPAIAQIPNGTLEIAYRQYTDGLLSKGVHEIKLSCLDDRCTMTTITLNQCGWGPEGRVFFPKVERTSTEEGDLVVTSIEKGILGVEERNPNFTTFKYRFGYRTRTREHLRSVIQVKSPIFFDGLTSFTGAAVKDSAILGKVVTWELRPLKGDFVTVTLDCAAMVRGLPEARQPN